MKKLKAWQVESLYKWVDCRLSSCVERSVDENDRWYSGKADAFDEVLAWLDSMTGGDDNDQKV